MFGRGEGVRAVLVWAFCSLLSVLVRARMRVGAVCLLLCDSCN